MLLHATLWAKGGGHHTQRENNRRTKRDAIKTKKVFSFCAKRGKGEKGSKTTRYRFSLRPSSSSRPTNTRTAHAFQGPSGVPLFSLPLPTTTTSNPEKKGSATSISLTMMMWAAVSRFFRYVSSIVAVIFRFASRYGRGLPLYHDGLVVCALSMRHCVCACFSLLLPRCVWLG